MTRSSRFFPLIRRKLLMIGLIIIILLLAGYAGVHAYAEHRARLEMDRFIAANAGQARIEYDHLKLSWFGFDARLTNLRVTPAGQSQPVRVKTVDVRGVDFFNQPPHFADLTVSGADLSPDNFGPEAKQSLQALGFNNVRGDAGLYYRFDPESHIFELKKGIIDLKGGGLLTVSAALSNMQFQLLKDPGAMLIFLITLTQTRVESARLEFLNGGLVERYIEQAASVMELTPDQYRQALLNGLDQQIINTPDEPTRQAITELHAFISNPGRLIITINPAEPVKLEKLISINDISELIGRLNLKAKADPPETGL